jgi:hypothetical protein
MAIKKSNFACAYMRNISQYDSGERCGPWASCSQFDQNVDNFSSFKNHRPLSKNVEKSLIIIQILIATGYFLQI